VNVFAMSEVIKASLSKIAVAATISVPGEDILKANS
jgi:hypothetical protein